MASDRDELGRFKPGTHWRPHRVFREREYLMQEYLERKRSAAEIAAEHGVGESAIDFWLRRHKIPRRTISEARAIKYWGQVGPANPQYGIRGELHPRWLGGGGTPERQRVFTRHEGRALRRVVHERDGHRCRRCGAEKNGPKSLHIHHVAPWANEELRLEVDNVITLCRSCHSWVHSKANLNREFLR